LADVADAVDAIEAGLDRNVTGTFNIGTGSGTNVNALFREPAALVGYDRASKHGPARVGDIRRIVLEPALAARRLDWRARASLQSGLAKTIQWIL
jgi:UDP-glucose 4-epimerase